MLTNPRSPQAERRGTWITAAVAIAALAALFAVRQQILDLVPHGDQLVVQFGIFLLAVVLGGLAIRAFISRLFFHLKGTSLYSWRPVATWCLYVVLGLGVLSALQINLTGLLAAGAIIGVIVGVAAQTSLGSVFAGLVLLMARPFVVGNWVHIRTYLFSGIEYSGIVTHVGVVYTTVDVSGRPVRIPNSGVLMAALTVTHIPLQVDIELQLPPETSLTQLGLRLERHLHLRPGETVTLHPVRLQTQDGGQLVCQLQIRSHLPIDMAQVSELVMRGGTPPAAADPLG
ncbi:MAG: mechanosensitive ion channel family protein [Candidatus Dormibacteraeota bacterium]|jgi:small-conductance mechanosensitive channel|nr:mechanosensitive ion channel family protein [Candidatus Dormibacteraeota bacterium]